MAVPPDPLLDSVRLKRPATKLCGPRAPINPLSCCANECEQHRRVEDHACERLWTPERPADPENWRPVSSFPESLPWSVPNRHRLAGTVDTEPLRTNNQSLKNLWEKQIKMVTLKPRRKRALACRKKMLTGESGFQNRGDSVPRGKVCQCLQSTAGRLGGNAWKDKPSVFSRSLNQKGQAFSQIGLGNARKAASLLQERHSISALLAHYHD
jgi:hypothetical protein